MNKIKFKKGYITVKSDVRDKILLLSHEIFSNRKLRHARPQREKMDRRHRFSYSVTDMSPDSFASDDKKNLQKILSQTLLVQNEKKDLNADYSHSGFIEEAFTTQGSTQGLRKSGIFGVRRSLPTLPSLR